MGLLAKIFVKAPKQPEGGAMAQPAEDKGRKRVPRLLWVIVLSLGLNVLAWTGRSCLPDAVGVWPLVSLLGFFLLGLVIGRWWSLQVTCAFAVIHAIPVYLGLLPGYLSTWEEALWWAFALAILLALTGLGVLGRGAIRWLQKWLKPETAVS
jgi:hypothetical protein